jgi:type IV pilus modification protein PilV
MNHSIIKTQKGIGLIEVLITTVVVAVGLLAVAALQGKFASSSGGSKTKAEALVLAEQKLEELRNNVTVTGYRDLNADGVADAATFIASDSPVGSNATFARSWTITDVAPPVPPFETGDPKLRKISVQVGWDGNGDGDSTDADEIVNVVTEMAWVDPGKASEYAAGNAGGSTSVASPRQNASEDAAAENVIGTDLAITDAIPTTSGSVGVDSRVNVTLPPAAGGGTITIYQVSPGSLPGSHYYTATHSQLSSIQEGVIAVFLCGDNNTCTHIQNHFGGVPHRIAGIVHSTSSNGFTNADGTDRLKVAWTSSSVSDCYNGPVTVVSGSGTNQYRHRPYECIYAGNCDATADNVNGCTYGVTDAQIASRHVGPGGEYGDVGLLGVDDQGGDREQVCFLEDTTDPATSPLLTPNGNTVLNENYLYSVTKRFYAARRIKRNGSSNDQKTEGINRSFTNHNFLVISRGTGATANQLCNLKAGTSGRSIALAPREIFKTLDEGVSNTSLADSVYPGTAGTAKTFTGIVNGSATNLKLMIPDDGNCYLNNNNGASLNAYACALPAGTTSTVIKGGSKERPSLNPSVFASCTKTDATACTWPGDFTASAVPSDSCTTPWGSTVTNGTSVTAYQSEAEPYGNVAVAPNTCQNAETRTCSAGAFSPAFTYTEQNCAIAASPNCTTPWGDAVVNGGHVNAYSVASVPFGYTCPAAVERTCTNGILSGSGNYGACAVQDTHNITVAVSNTGTGTVSGVSVTGTGATCVGTTCTVDSAWTGTLTATGTCSGGGSVSGTSGTIPVGAIGASISLGNCNGPVCTLPWGGSIASGGSVTAYSSATVPYPSTCASHSETLYCTNGALSGGSTNQSCSVVCTVPTINGMSTNNAADKAAVAAAITNAGFTVGTATDIGSGTKAVSLQSPAAGSTDAACGSAITYTYN